MFTKKRMCACIFLSETVVITDRVITLENQLAEKIKELAVSHNEAKVHKKVCLLSSVKLIQICFPHIFN